MEKRLREQAKAECDAAAVQGSFTLRVIKDGFELCSSGFSTIS